MENNAAVAEDPQVSGQAEGKENTSSASQEPLKSSPSSDKEDVTDFINRMSAPRKENKRAFEMDQEGDNPEGGEPITDDDEGNMEYLDYSPDHRHTALFFIGLIDSAMGWVGAISTGQDPERYQKFAKGSPPDFYVNSTAAMVKKYHARMSLEMMFLTALAMVYGPTVATIRQDRKILKEQAMEEQIRRRSAKMV